MFLKIGLAVKSNLPLVYSFTDFGWFLTRFWVFLLDRIDTQFSVKPIRLVSLFQFLNHDNNLFHPYLKVSMIF